MQETRTNPYLIPLSIVFAGALVAGALVFTNKNQRPEQNLPQGDINALREITGKDHYLGDIEKAEIAIVEYSDTECPFCKEFHGTMLQVMADPELKDKVTWVYRHFPIDSLHPKARNEAEATECAAELGGNAAFWNYTNKLYEVTPANNGLDPKELPNIAASVGLNREAFVKCLSEEKHQEKIQADFLNAIEIGGNGTPWTLVVSKKTGSVTPLNGSVKYAPLKQIIKNILK